MTNLSYSVDPINELIRNAPITRFELARRMGVSPSHLYNVLNKKKPLSEKMAKKIIAELTPQKKPEEETYKIEIRKANIILGLKQLADKERMTTKEILEFISNQFFPVPNSEEEGNSVPKEVLVPSLENIVRA